MRHPMNSPTILPSGSPTIMAMQVPVTIMLRARCRQRSGTTLTASGEAMDQKTEWAHATPMRETISPM